MLWMIISLLNFIKNYREMNKPALYKLNTDMLCVVFQPVVISCIINLFLTALKLGYEI